MKSCFSLFFILDFTKILWVIKISFNSFVLECKGKVSDAIRIRMSLVKVIENGCKIQTGAYSNIPEKVFIFKTEAIDAVTKFFKDVIGFATAVRTQTSPEVEVANGLGQRSRIFSRSDDGDHMIILEVSSFTENSFYAQIIKIRLLR